MMAQYLKIKAEHSDFLLFYRMGDFYELFFDDAVIASEALSIALTKRGKHDGDDIPMCGVPVHSADDYLQRLIAKGHRVAVCEQTEDPAEARKRGSKAVVRREVVRLVTAGTVTEENLLDGGRNNYLAALSIAPSDNADDANCALAWIDITTGEFRVSAFAERHLASLLARVDPAELLVPERVFDDQVTRYQIEQALGSAAAISPLAASFFESAMAGARIKDTFGVASVDAFGSFSRRELSAAAAVLAYVEKTQIDQHPPLSPPRRIMPSASMQIDPATRANLELFQTLSGQRAGSLISAVDRTATAAGSRLLASRLASPLCDPEAINHRLDTISWLIEQAVLRNRVAGCLKRTPDILRALSRIGLERGGPRDLQAIQTGIATGIELAACFSAADLAGEGELPEITEALSALPENLFDRLRAALADDVPLQAREGGFVRTGYLSELDELRTLRDESRKVIAELQADYCSRTGIKSLKVRHNNVLGYFVEVTAPNATQLTSGPHAELFVHRQTLANVMRFTTTELAELEQKIASASDRAIAIEREIFMDLCDERVSRQRSMKISRSIAIARSDALAIFCSSSASSVVVNRMTFASVCL